MSTLEQLTVLRLRDPLEDLSNPLCSETPVEGAISTTLSADLPHGGAFCTDATYRRDVTSLLPRLIWLDGKQRRGSVCLCVCVCVCVCVRVCECMCVWKYCLFYAPWIRGGMSDKSLFFRRAGAGRGQRGVHKHAQHGREAER